MMSQALKPCPFCGGEAKIARTTKYGLYAYCAACNAQVGCRYLRTEKEAIEQWNTRVADKQKEGEQ